MVNLWLHQRKINHFSFTEVNITPAKLTSAPLKISHGKQSRHIHNRQPEMPAGLVKTSVLLALQQGFSPLTEATPCLMCAGKQMVWKILSCIPLKASLHIQDVTIYNSEEKTYLGELSFFTILRWKREGARQTAMFMGVIWFSSTEVTSLRKQSRVCRTSRFSSAMSMMAACTACSRCSLGTSGGSKWWSGGQL